jgi:hypothetical protein
MSNAAYYREQLARAQRFLNTPPDALTRERLMALAAEYLAKAEALEAGPEGNSPETM